MGPRVYVIGYPGDVGGANTELWHTVRLWRRFGIDVTMIPTWTPDPEWQRRLAAIGCRTVVVRPDELQTIEGLRGAIAVGFCNSQFLARIPRLRELGCRLVWVSCMNWLFPVERLHYRATGTLDAHVFQSRYQRAQLVPQLRRYGFRDSQGWLIRGPLETDEFPFRPLIHRPGTALIVGRISRASPDKFARNLWQIFARVPHPLRARVLGFDDEVAARVGPPPRWAECLAPGSQPVGPFLATLHAMAPTGGEAVENWPRVGLEAMAAGVPLVVPAAGGWTEMIRHGQTGYLCQSDDETAYWLARLAYDEDHRLQIVQAARAALVADLAEPGAIAAKWLELFESLAPIATRSVSEAIDCQSMSRRGPGLADASGY